MEKSCIDITTDDIKGKTAVEWLDELLGKNLETPNIMKPGCFSFVLHIEFVEMKNSLPPRINVIMNKATT